ncbi:MAG: ATP-binding cassette domain-containing protein [Clostridiales bacterium]|jgi:ABC-2 type transport system ATP-binding protein|nr:ATP-binding cassette domain-containing protein [Clostridiales bacterium]
MSQFVVRTSNLSKKYGERYAVRNVDVEIRRGQIYGLIGQNGAGKTTFIRMLTGLISQTDGEIELFGKSGADLEKARGSIGSIVETPSLFPNMTAEENLETQRRLAGFDKNNADEMLELCGIADTGSKKVKNFSLGMRQRLALTLALLTEPEFVILDEPINGLDPKGIVENREMLKRLAAEKGITILISSHILSELSLLATNYGIIHNGRLIKQLPAKQLLSECRRYIKVITGDAPKTAEILKRQFAIKEVEILDDGEIRVYEQLDKTPRMVKELVDADVQVKSIGVTGQDLESYFMNITGGAM